MIGVSEADRQPEPGLDPLLPAPGSDACREYLWEWHTRRHSTKSAPLFTWSALPEPTAHFSACRVIRASGLFPNKAKTHERSSG